MAVPPPRSFRLCEICREPVPRLNNESHMRAAHPDIVAVQRIAGLRYLTLYLPLSLVAAIFAVISGTLQAWWWRIGLLAGIYAICGLHLLSLIQEWRAEKPLRLRVVIPCAVCGERMQSAALLDHIRAVHPAIGRVAARAPWIIWPGVFVPVGYVMLLGGLAILGFFDKAFWDLFPVLGFVPLLAYLVALVVASQVLYRRYLRPAQREWRAAHPRTRQ